MGEQVRLGLAVAYGVDVVAVVCLDVPPAGGVVVGAVAWDAALAGAEDTVLQALLGVAKAIGVQVATFWRVTELVVPTEAHYERMVSF